VEWVQVDARQATQRALELAQAEKRCAEQAAMLQAEQQRVAQQQQLQQRRGKKQIQVAQEKVAQQVRKSVCGVVGVLPFPHGTSNLTG
jgi:hypothetical protein